MNLIDRITKKLYIPEDVPVIASPRSCVGRQTINALSTAAPTLLTVPAGAKSADIQADGGTVRITLEGTAPTALIGTRIDDGSIYHVDTSLAAVKIIAIAANTAVQIAYFDKA